MTEVTDPAMLAEINAQEQRFRRNSDWLQAHVPSVYARRQDFQCLSACPRLHRPL